MKNTVLIKFLTYRYSIYDIIEYFKAQYRYCLIETIFVRKHIKEQITWREEIVDKECLSNGECKMCGCNLPQLLYTTKSCDKPCYPTLLPKKIWDKFKEGRTISDRNGRKWMFNPIFLLPLKPTSIDYKNLLILCIQYLLHYKRI